MVAVVCLVLVNVWCGLVVAVCCVAVGVVVWLVYVD